MNSELLSFRVLLLSPAASERRLLCHGAVEANVPIDALEAGDISAARAILARINVDLIFVSSTVSSHDRAALINELQSTRPQPFVIVLANGEDRAGFLGAAGVDGIMPPPKRMEDAKAILERCIRLCFPSRILLVDDSATMRAIVRKILSGSRFRLDVVEAQEGIGALSLLESGNFDIVFLDYNMPGLNGVETLSEIRREHPRLQVVLMTSTADKVVAERARAAGAIAFLKKPFYPSDIDAILNRILGLGAAV